MQRDDPRDPVIVCAHTQPAKGEPVTKPRRLSIGKVQAALILSSLTVTVALAAAREPQMQGDTIRIRGQVTTEGGGPISSATIRTDATRGALAQQFTAQKEFIVRTGKNGDWSLLGITRGLWIFEVTAPNHLPHVVIVPISMMLNPGISPWETSFALLPVSALGPDAAGAPGRRVLDIADQIATGNKGGARQALQTMPEGLDATGLCAAGDLALLVREPLLARKLFELAATADPKSYRAQLGIASAAMLAFDLDRAIKAYGETRKLSTNKRLQQTMSHAIRELQQVVTIPR
jgi:hypothetical protein